MSTSALAPADVIASAVQDLYAHLREIVDRGPTSDPSLVDELRQLTRSIGGRITRARKRQDAQDTAPTPTTPEPSKQQAEPARPVSDATEPITPVVAPTAPAPAPRVDDPEATRPVIRPAAKPSAAVTVKLPKAGAGRPPAQQTSHRRALRRARHAAEATVSAFWKIAAGAVIGPVVAFFAVYFGKALADTGAAEGWIWAYGVAVFALFSVGLCFAMTRAAKRWAEPKQPHRVPARQLLEEIPHRDQPRPTGRADRS